MRSLSLLIAVTLSLALAGAWAQAPVITYVTDASPQIVCGDSFDPAGTQVVELMPPDLKAEALLAVLQKGPSALPVTPPASGAQNMQVLDTEPHCLVVGLRGGVCWVKTKAGVSAPFLPCAPKPCWLSDERVPQGGMLHLFGFRLRILYRESTLVLKGPKLLTVPQVVEPRSPRTPDSRLVYFQVPKDAPSGNYQLWIHNGLGGEYGWVKAGSVEVVAPVTTAPKRVSARDLGAKGDGLANDGPALQSALNAAAAGGGIVDLPPGTYLTDTTLQVPPGVSLRGAGASNTILRGIGYNPHLDRVAWFTALVAPATAVVRLADNTRLDDLTVEGATSKGSGGAGMVEAFPRDLAFPDGGTVSNVTIRHCTLRSQCETTDDSYPLYDSALYVGPTSRRINILENDIWGAVNLGMMGTTRTEVISNKIHGGTAADVVSLSGWGIDCLLDANLFVDTPGRLCFGPRRHCYFRYNEVSGAFRGTWANAEEIYLVHGGAIGTTSFAWGGTPTTLVDTRQNWQPGQYRDCAVLIISGKGFGQFRTVTDNTKTTLTVDAPWVSVPDQTSEYYVAPSFMESAFFANLNETPCRLSLWLNVIACQVEMHRDSWAGGMDVWGADNSDVKADNTVADLNSFMPAYFNVIRDCWLDGTSVHLWSGAKPSNAHVGPPLFGNYVVGNRLRQPHMDRSGFEMLSVARATGGVRVGNNSAADMTKPQAARVALSHTIVSGNFLSFTDVGLTVSDFADKTFLLGNEFQQVQQPVLDWGARTVSRGNKVFTIDPQGEHTTALPDSLGSRLITEKPRPQFTVPAAQAPVPLMQSVMAVKVFVSLPTFAFYSGVRSEAVQQQCADNLRKAWALIQQYDAKHGSLPQAGFYPHRPAQDPDSLAVLLGPAAAGRLTCPTCAAGFSGLPLHYVWNEKLNGKPLKSLANKPATWVLMDFVGCHDWMVANQKCGHRGGVNILYADGSVKWSKPWGAEAWNKDAPRQWADWARE